MTVSEETMGDCEGDYVVTRTFTAVTCTSVAADGDRGGHHLLLTVGAMPPSSATRKSLLRNSPCLT